MKEALSSPEDSIKLAEYEGGALEGGLFLKEVSIIVDELVIEVENLNPN